MEWRPRLKIYQGSNRKNTFNPTTFEAYSYGHWQYVKKVKGKILFNYFKYSHTTAKHQREMFQFLMTKMKVKTKDIIILNQAENLREGFFLDDFYKKLFLAEFAANRKGLGKEYLKKQKKTVLQLRTEIKTLLKLGARRLAGQDIENLRQKVVNNELHRLQENREKSRITREKRRELLANVRNQFESTDAVAV